MSIATLARRVDALEKRADLGVYTLLAELGPDGTIVSWWDGMRGCPITAEQIERLREKGYSLTFRCYDTAFFHAV